MTTILEEIAENLPDGIRISEFPVTLVAAKAAPRGGMEVIAGRAEHRARREP